MHNVIVLYVEYYRYLVISLKVTHSDHREGNVHGLKLCISEFIGHVNNLGSM